MHYSGKVPAGTCARHYKLFLSGFVFTIVLPYFVWMKTTYTMRMIYVVTVLLRRE